MELMHTLQYAQLVPVGVLGDADITLGYRLATAELRACERLRRQLFDVVRMHAARHFAHVLDQIHQMLQRSTVNTQFLESTTKYVTRSKVIETEIDITQCMSS